MIAKGKTLISSVVLCFCFFAPISAQTPRDVVVLKNGDRISGEIKRLERGLLYVTVPYVDGSIAVDWAQVVSIESARRFEFELISGEIVVGVVDAQSSPSVNPDQLAIKTASEVITRPKPTLATIYRLDHQFWQRLSADVDFGFSLARSNNLRQYTLGASVNYRGRRNLASIYWDSLLSTQADTDNTDREHLQLTYARNLRGRNWFALAVADFLSNSEQQLDLRSTAGGGLGRHVIRHEDQSLDLGGGVVVSREKFSPEARASSSGTNVEAMFLARHNIYRFKKLDLTSKLMVYPSLTIHGRVRVDFDSGIKLKFFNNNWYWKLSVYDNFDNKPPVSTPSNDYGITAAFGFSFNN